MTGNVVQIIIQGKDNTTPAANSASASMAKLNNFAKSAGAALAGYFSIRAIGNFTQGVIDSADAMGKLAQSVGASTEFLSAMNHAAELSNVSMQGMETGFRELNKSIAENDVALRDLGIAARDEAGNLRSVEQVLPEIADRFADFGDGARKSELAMKLFGKAGTDMIPMLNGGAAGLREAADEARKFGLIIDQKTAKEAEEFNDAVTRLQLRLKGLALSVMKEILPAFSDMGGEMDKLGNSFSGFEAVVHVAIRVLRLFWDTLKLVGHWIGNAASAWVDGFNVAKNGLLSLGDAIKLLAEGKFSLARVAFAETLDGIKTDFDQFKVGAKATFAEAGKDFENLWNNLSGNGPKAPEMQGPPVPPGFQFAGAGGGGGGEPAKTSGIQEYFRMLDELRLATMEGAAQQQAQEEQYHRDQLARIEELTKVHGEALALRGLEEDRHAKRVKTIQEQEQRARLASVASNLQITANMFGAFAGLAAATGKKNSKLYRGLMYTQAVISTAAGVARAFADHGMPQALFIAATVAAQGAAQIATIKSAGEEGQAHAGLDYVPRESTWMLQKGERVVAPEQNRDLTAFLEGNGGSSAGGTGGAMHVTINLDGDVLARGMGEMSRDGRLTINAKAIV